MFNPLKNLTRYEKRIYVLLFLLVLPNAFTVLITLFTQFTPEYHCNVDNESLTNQELTNATYDESNLDLFIPYQKVDFGKLERSKCLKYNYTENYSSHNVSRNIIKCSSYTFYFNEGTNSAIKDFSMVCDGKWKKTFATTAYFFGKMIGGLVGGWMSDRFGRLPCFLITTGVQFLTSFCIGFSSNFTFYTILLFLMGWGSTMNFAAATILGVELTAVKNRNKLNTVLHVGYAIGYMLTPVVGYFFQDWRWYAKVTGLVGLLYIPFIWLLDESPRWLNSVGRKAEAKAIIEKISKYNGDDGESKEMFLISEEPNKENLWSMWFKILKQPVIALQTFTLFIGWAMVTMMYYATTLNTNSLAGDRFLNCFYGALTQFFSYGVSYLALERLGRRNSYVFFTGTMSIAIMIAVPLSLWNETAVTVITMIEMMGATVSFYVLYVYTGELYPTCIRQTALTNAGAFSRIGAMLAPMLMDFEGSKLASSMVLGTVALLSALSFLFFPKTSKLNLPDTIEDVVNMKRFKIFKKFRGKNKEFNVEL